MIDYRLSDCFLVEFYTKPPLKNMVNNIVYYYISSRMFIIDPEIFTGCLIAKWKNQHF
jgi:hypothetical protein